MLKPDIIIAAVANGLLTGAVYALIALGLTLVYGVLHIINFAHGATLTAAMFAVFVCHHAFCGSIPTLAVFVLTPLFFALGLRASNVSSFARPATATRATSSWLRSASPSSSKCAAGDVQSDTRSIDVPYGFSVLEVGPLLLSVPKVIAFVTSLAVAALLRLLLVKTDTGKAIRAVAKEKAGSALVGIRVEHIYAITFGLGAACLAIAACLLMPTYLVNPRSGNAFVLVAFTIVVLGGMGSIGGALAGGLIIGVVESLSGLFLGESLGQIGIFLIFILVLLVKPTGLSGARV